MGREMVWIILCHLIFSSHISMHSLHPWLSHGRALPTSAGETQ